MMDLIYNSGYYFALFVIPFVVYFLLFKKNDGRSVYTGRDWFYYVKLYFAKNAVRKYQAKFSRENAALRDDNETILKTPTDQTTNSQHFFGVDQRGNIFALKFTLRYENVVKAFIYLKLNDGNTYVFPDDNNLRLIKTPKNEWKIIGLNIEILEPSIRVRICFNGLLQNISVHSRKKVQHVRFSFIFNACGSPTYIPHQMDCGLLAEALAKENWRDGSWVDYLADQSGYEQFGVLQGCVTGDSYPDELVLNLTSCHTRHKGIDDRFLLKRAVRIFIADAYGNLINIVIKSFKSGCSQLNYGSAILSDNTIVPIDGIDILLKNFSTHKIIPEMITTEVKVGKKLFKCVIHLNISKSVVSTDEEEHGFQCYTVPGECDVNTNEAKAVLEFWYSKTGTVKFTPNTILRPRTVDVAPDDYVVNINSEEAKIFELTGGKGNSLALLSSLHSTHFTVPEGFIVTVKAFKRQLTLNTSLPKTVLLLEDVCYGKKEGNIETICNEAVTCLKTETILPEIKSAILTELKSIGTSDKHGWAVRSSAIGEDSEELSAAGQNDTFLGCITEKEVLKSVLACWASLFSYQSVQYRRQHGMPVLSEMAVVVQRMVPADAAGVLFTCHPFSLNPSRMVITSNYGLGESVVSGESDPDTFVLSRTWEDKVMFLNRTIGRKNKILKLTESGVKELEREDFEIVDDSSISEHQAVRLGELGVLLEKAFGGHLDIEWAFYEDKLYVLQSRPITTLNSWSDFDLTHELDYPVRTEYAILSLGNIGEVIPNAMSMLAQTSTVQCLAWASQLRLKKQYDPFSLHNIVRRQHRGLLDVVSLVYNNVTEDVKVSSTILDLAIFGHPVLDEKINDICKNLKGVTPAVNLMKTLYEILSLALRNTSIYREMKELTSDFLIDVSYTNTLLDNYLEIERNLKKLPYIVRRHMETSSVSVFYQFVAMNILLEGSKTLTPDHCTDFATILSCCNDIISAEVPMYLEKIARIIRDEGYEESFCAIKPEFGAVWLEGKCPEAYKIFKEFLEKHGHRSQGEFDVMEESWSENPAKVISMIQANARSESSINRRNRTTDDIISSLMSPKHSITKTIIRFIIGRIQSSVRLRELTKYELVKAIDTVRQAYRKLAKQMVQQGLLPSSDLLYHLTHYEIGDVIRKGGPLLVAKAFRRQKLYPKWNKLRFPEISFGVPVPENETEAPETSTCKVCVGTAACAGTVKARACVIQSLEEINQLRAGDILITFSTDIGWSPYFPMLSGIVTELGGLISHGAVVAREYGLPCIVGVKDVTKVFKTGDIVVLSGTTGKIGKAAEFLEVL